MAFVFNVGLIGLSVWEFNRSSWVYHDLMHNRRAFGREIAPEVIVSLRHPYRVWISESVAAVAAGFGALLALNLFIAAKSLRSNSIGARRRFRQYRFWKPLGTLFTAAALYWSATEDSTFWIAATSHIPLGSGPPILSTAMLIVCGIVPVWWLRRSFQLD